MAGVYNHMDMKCILFSVTQLALLLLPFQSQITSYKSSITKRTFLRQNDYATTVGSQVSSKRPNKSKFGGAVQLSNVNKTLRMYKPMRTSPNFVGCVKNKH